MAYALSIPVALGSSQAGLELRADLEDGTTLDGVWREEGEGAYTFTATDVPNSYIGAVRIMGRASGSSDDFAFKAATAINPPSVGGSGGDPLTQEVPGLYAPGTAGAALARLFSASSVQLPGPIVSAGRKIVLVRGDDYAVADGRGLTFAGAWTGVVARDIVVFVIRDRSGREVIRSSSALVATTAGLSVSIGLTMTQTALLSSGSAYTFALWAVHGGRDVTLQNGIVDVLAGSMP